MSMRDYAVDEYGLLLDKQTMQALAKVVCKEYTDKDYDEDPYGFNEEIEGKFGNIDYISNFTGEAFGVNQAGRDEYRGNIIAFSDDSVYILTAKNTPLMFKRVNSRLHQALYSLWLFH